MFSLRTKENDDFNQLFLFIKLCGTSCLTHSSSSTSTLCRFATTIAIRATVGGNIVAGTGYGDAVVR